MSGWLLPGMLTLGGLAAVMQTADFPRGPVLVAAHRGGALLWPENSLLAFRSALALGVDYLEMDVHLSRDDEVMVIHDPRLDRTTTGRGPVRDRCLAELQALRLRDPRGVPTAEALPTLDEVAALVSAAGRQVLIEIKVGADGARYPGVEEKVLAVLDRHRLGHAAVVMAFEPETWRRVRALCPSIRVGALFSRRTLRRSGATLAAAMDAAARAGVAFIGLDQAMVTGAAVAQAREEGVALGAWTVNDAPAIRRAIERGVAIVISDRPDLVKGLLRP